ncbi:response regulator transcription factor [Cohnella xylanilytica]|uniref:Response regulator transcription factor n=1 Tax=Cohnella xylanilytica TaxID=557555 RepID=A0A841U687_9BACL|nr:response regulator transcription factor [Cohnella xylanilytica]MBB6695152.1 response regulator transcription factor [Cohnella xylanilytica]
MDKTRILIIEDESPIADLLRYGLDKEGFETLAVPSASEGLLETERFRPDLLLLDWMLPDGSGIDVCKQVTATRNIPIIMITAKSDIADKIIGLELGADDYVTKPFDLREVVARVRTLLRRAALASRTEPGREEPEAVRAGRLEIAERERLVRMDGAPVDLTPKEFDLLLALIRRRGQVFTRTELLDSVWGYDYAGDTRTVDIHIQRLRKKLGASDLIATVFGVGYKFEKRAD